MQMAWKWTGISIECADCGINRCVTTNLYARSEWIMKRFTKTIVLLYLFALDWAEWGQPKECAKLELRAHPSPFRYSAGTPCEKSESKSNENYFVHSAKKFFICLFRRLNHAIPSKDCALYTLAVQRMANTNIRSINMSQSYFVWHMYVTALCIHCDGKHTSSDLNVKENPNKLTRLEPRPACARCMGKPKRFPSGWSV